MTEGDESALSAVYDRYSGMLFGMLMRILRDSQAAEEILQDLFLQLWRNPERFDETRGSLAAWLLVSGRNRAISRLRRRDHRESPEDIESFPANAVPSSVNIEEEAQRMQLMDRLRGAMAALPPDRGKPWSSRILRA